MQHLKNDSIVLLREQLQVVLKKVEVSAWRLQLHTPHVYATTPMIRGVWGRALKHLNNTLYHQVFAGANSNGHTLPRYIIRPAPPDPETAPALDWILFNIDQCHEHALWRAWDIACGMGLGPRREPFGIRQRIFLTPENIPPGWNSWTLAEVQWPIPSDPVSTPCILSFEVPVRLIKQGQLISSPQFTDLIAASLRRIAALAKISRGVVYRDLMRAVRREASRTVAHTWVGEKCNLVRWSAAQQREVELYGITGTITLPKGPGYLWPLLAAAQWSHLGKGTVYGMGEMRVLPLSRSVGEIEMLSIPVAWD